MKGWDLIERNFEFGPSRELGKMRKLHHFLLHMNPTTMKRHRGKKVQRKGIYANGLKDSFIHFVNISLYLCSLMHPIMCRGHNGTHFL